MRKCLRPDVPEFLRANCERWNAQWVALKQSNPSASFQWYTHEGKAVNHWLREPLAEMTLGHCAFCDRYTVEPDSIEHFRPKSNVLFLHLAYDWGNLYFCCGQCQKHKGDKWSELLLQPDSDDYEFTRYFEFDFTTGSIRPNSFASPEERMRADTTIEYYGLDSLQRRQFRKLALKQWNASQRNLRHIDHFAYRDFLEVGGTI